MTRRRKTRKGDLFNRIVLSGAHKGTKTQSFSDRGAAPDLIDLASGERPVPGNFACGAARPLCGFVPLCEPESERGQ
jgi:hypothetical protein